MFFLSRRRSRSEDLREYHEELQRKCDGKITARRGRPGEREEYPDPGEEYQQLCEEQRRVVEEIRALEEK